MPQEPKKKHSRGRQGKRRAGIKLSIPNAIVCSNCAAMIMPHSACPNCGFYRGKEVLKSNRTK